MPKAFNLANTGKETEECLSGKTSHRREESCNDSVQILYSKQKKRIDSKSPQEILFLPTHQSIRVNGETLYEFEIPPVIANLNPKNSVSLVNRI